MYYIDEWTTHTKLKQLKAEGSTMQDSETQSSANRFCLLRWSPQLRSWMLVKMLVQPPLLPSSVVTGAQQEGRSVELNCDLDTLCICLTVWKFDIFTPQMMNKGITLWVLEVKHSGWCRRWVWQLLCWWAETMNNTLLIIVGKVYSR